MTKLIQTAIQMRDMARAPYSNYKVGAAVETIDGEMPVTLCPIVRNKQRYSLPLQQDIQNLKDWPYPQKMGAHLVVPAGRSSGNYAVIFPFSFVMKRTF